MEYIDGINNKITVINDSNFPINVDFAYTDDYGMNANQTSSSVAGIFDYNNATLLSKVDANNINTASITNPTMVLNTVITGLASGEGYYYQTTSSDTALNPKNSDSIYFSLIGKPDRDIGLTAMQSVGSISVIITPGTPTSLETK